MGNSGFSLRVWFVFMVTGDLQWGFLLSSLGLLFCKQGYTWWLLSCCNDGECSLDLARDYSTVVVNVHSVIVRVSNISSGGVQKALSPYLMGFVCITRRGAFLCM